MEGKYPCDRCALGRNSPIGLSHAHLRYLLAIYQLSQGGTEVSATSLARSLGVKKASVTKMMATLMEKNLVVKERYSKIYLTCSGCLTAKRLAEQAGRLALLIQQEMGLSKALSCRAAYAAVCAISDVEGIPLSGDSAMKP